MWRLLVTRVDGEPRRLKVWQILFLLLPFLLWWAWSSYDDFTRLEEDGGVLYVGRMTAALYTLGGKWAVVGFPLVIAALWVYAMVVTLRLSKRADELAAQHREQADPDWQPAPPPAPPPAELPVAIATGVAPGPRRFEPLVSAAPSAPARAAVPPPTGDGPRLLR